MRLFPIALTLAGLLGAAAVAPARAAVTVIGGGYAEECSKATLAGRSDLGVLELCDHSLQFDELTAHDRAGTLINRGIIKLRRHEMRDAKADFDDAIAIAPRIGEAWVNRGALLVDQKKYQLGLADIDKGIQLGCSEPEKAYFNRALAYEGLDDEKSAYLDYEQALTLKPGWEAPAHELLRFTVTRQ